MLLLASWCLIQGLSNIRAEDPTGHNKPLGSHKSPLGVTLIGKFSSPMVFYEHFVKESQPLLMKSPLFDNPFPAFEIWTDDFLREEYGSEVVSVEQSKKEKRGGSPSKMTLHGFLDIYRKKNVYMVQSLPDAMKNDVHLPVTLQCGGFQHVLTDVVVWMSSGGTKSVLHRDKLDNLLCVLNGTKDVLLIDKCGGFQHVLTDVVVWMSSGGTKSVLHRDKLDNLLCVLNGTKDVLLIDKIYKGDVEADGFVEEGTYSKVDVDSVNLKQYPRLKNVPWHRAHLKTGDCIFIPYGWYHQINSSGSDSDRSLAVNYWFSHLWWHNQSDCRDFETFNVTEPLTKFHFASTNEQIRSHILEPFSEMDDVSKENFVSAFLASAPQTEELFNYIKKGKNRTLSWEDLYQFSIDEAVMKFPEVFAAGVTVPDQKTKKKAKKEPIQVQDDFDVDQNQENVVKVPMMDPDSEEFERLLAEVVKQGDFVDTRKKDSSSDSSPKIQDINVKITKGQKNMKQESTKDTASGKTKEKSKPRHDEF